MATEEEMNLANGLWTLLLAQGSSAGHPKLTLNVLNGEWKSKLKYEMKNCKMVKFKLKWFLQFPNHFRIVKGDIVAIPVENSETNDEEVQNDTVMKPVPIPKEVTLQSALKRAEEIAENAAHPAVKMVSFGKTEIFKFKCTAAQCNWWSTPEKWQGKKGKRKSNARYIEKKSDDLLERYIPVDLLPPESDEDDSESTGSTQDAGSVSPSGITSEDADSIVEDGFVWLTEDRKEDGTVVLERLDSPTSSDNITAESRLAEQSVSKAEAEDGDPSHVMSQTRIHFWLHYYGSKRTDTMMRSVVRGALAREYGL